MLSLAPVLRLGIVALSSPAPDRPAIESAVEGLRAAGHAVRLGETAFAAEGYKSASIERRVRDLHAMFAAEDVDVILNVTGGYNANELLEFLDYDFIAAHPKIFVGYSDITALLCAFSTKASVPVVCGPMLVDAAHYPDALRELLRTLQRGRELFMQPPLVWEDGPGDARPAPEPRALPGKKKDVQGSAFGANLSTLCLLLGTPYAPTFDERILFLEYDKEESAALPSLERMLWQLRQSGAFRSLGGIVFGLLERSVAAEEKPRNELADILTRVTEGYDFPVIYDAPFGHVYPSWTLIAGQSVRISGTTIA